MFISYTKIQKCQFNKSKAKKQYFHTSSQKKKKLFQQSRKKTYVTTFITARKGGYQCS